MIKNLINYGTAAAGMLFVAGGLQAATFEGTTTGTFENAVGGVGMVVSGEGTSRIEWGTPLIDDPSALEYVPVEEFAAECGEWFTVGNLTYENRVTAVGTGLQAVNLVVDVTFTLPGAGGDTFTYAFNLQPTVNQGDPTAPENADVVELPIAQTAEVVIDGRTYQITMGFGTDKFVTIEGENETVDLVAYIQCPDGGLTIMLLGAALSTVGVFSRRMKI